MEGIVFLLIVVIVLQVIMISFFLDIRKCILIFAEGGDELMDEIKRLCGQIR
jgi:hypothetical protein